MKILISLFFFFVSSSDAACDFKKHITKVYSFSGPVTMIFKELGLINHHKLLGISIFHPITTDEFKGEVFPGGVFVSRDALSKASGGVVFYDESRDLRKILMPMSSIQGVEIITRNLTSLEVTKKVMEELESFAIIGCEKEKLKLFSKLTSLEKNILKKIDLTKTYIFYVGEFKMGRAPDLVMSNDGVVKWLRKKARLKTYPSDLAYVNWSAKIKESFPATTLHIAIKDSGKYLKKSFVKVDENISLVYPGSLIPGITQLEAFSYLIENLNN